MYLRRAIVYLTNIMHPRRSSICLLKKLVPQKLIAAYNFVSNVVAIVSVIYASPHYWKYIIILDVNLTHNREFGDRRQSTMYSKVNLHSIRILLVTRK